MRATQRVIAGLTAILLGWPAAAHLVSGTRSLRERVEESDLVVRARVVSTSDFSTRSTARAGTDRPFVEIEVLEVLKGSPVGEMLRFVQHGHGVADFAPGQEHLIFLIDVVRSRELDVLAEDGSFRWVSLQEHDDAHPLEPRGRGAVIEATRAYVAAGEAPDPATRAAFLRTGTRVLLASGDARSSASALRDLVGAPRQTLIGPADLPILEGVLDDPATPIGVRVALLAELERQGLLDGEARWLGWLGDPVAPADQVVVIRAAKNDPRPRVRARLTALLGDERDDIAAAAAAALGRAGDAAAVTPLAAALAHPSPRVRHAAVRGLGATRLEAALVALELAGANHPDPTTRRLAAAEARKRRAALAERAKAAPDASAGITPVD